MELKWVVKFFCNNDTDFTLKGQNRTKKTIKEQLTFSHWI